MTRDCHVRFREQLGVKIPRLTRLSDTVRGADASAMLYTIVATARANQIPVGTYLEWLLRELPKAEAEPRKCKLDLSPFMPWAFKVRAAGN